MHLIGVIPTPNNNNHMTHHHIRSIRTRININSIFAISGYSSSHPTHIRSVLLHGCASDYMCRFLCLDAARHVTIDKQTDWQSRDSERLCDVTRNR